MSYIVDGAEGRDWQATNGAFYKLSEVLVPILRESANTMELARRIEDALDASTHYVDFSDLLRDAETGRAWTAAVERAVSELRSRGSSEWHDPSGVESFLTKVSELKNLTAYVRFPETIAA